MTTRAVLFDIDGTLVDSNYLHVEAWQQAFEGLGLQVDSWRIHRAIGQDSGELLGALLPHVGEQLRERAKTLHSDAYRALMPRLRPFRGARELLAALAARDIRVVLATSAPQQELDALLRVLDSADAIHDATSSDDVETAKPEPDIIAIALERAGVSAAEAIMVGDATWDMSAAGRAGVRAFGVRSGGIASDELRSAGASEVFDDVAELGGELDRLLGA